MQQTLNAEKESLRAIVQDILPKIGRMDLDIGILRSQRDVDRARMERLEMGMTVLEAADSTILNSVRRLERGVEDLSDSYSQLERGVEDHTYSKCDPTPMAVSVPILASHGHRTLADELMDTDWTDGTTPEQSDTDIASLSDRDEQSPFVPPTPVATPLQPSSCPPILPVPGRFVRAWLPNASDFARAARLHRFLCGTYKALPTPPRVLVALAILTCTCLLSVYALSSVADRFFVTIDNRPIWEKSRRL